MGDLVPDVRPAPSLTLTDAGGSRCDCSTRVLSLFSATGKVVQH